MATLKEQLDGYLRTAGPFPQDWGVAATQLQFTLRVESVDALACSLEEIDFRPTGRTGWTAAELRTFADRICEQVKYLMEPLKVVEFDANSIAAQARSTTPTEQDDQRSYFELAISSSSANLRRYRTRPGQPRQQSTMVLTREVFARLLADLDRLAVIP